MATLTMPTVTVIFRAALEAAVQRTQKGTVALIVRDAIADEAPKTYALRSAGQIPKELGVENQKAIRRAFKGGAGQPTKVLAYVMAAAGTVTAECDALKWLATQQFDYLAGHDALSSQEAQVIKAWIVQQREDYHATYKAVLPDTKADHEAVVNFVADEIKTDEATFTTAGYCGRIAGILAGTPMTQAGTFAVLPEVRDIKRLTGPEEDAAVGRGELILTHDGEKVKLGRAVNSLTSIAPPKTEAWKKIKLVEISDMVSHDIRVAIQDGYIGKVSNDYDHKMLLVSSIRDYLGGLARSGIIERAFTCDIDVDAQDTYLQSKGVATADLSEQEIREANTDTHVFLLLKYRPIDAMEDVAVVIEL